MAKAVDFCVGEFNAQNLANSAWAFAAAGRSDILLFARFAKAAERRILEFNAQGLANTLWAFMTVGHF